MYINNALLTLLICVFAIFNVQCSWNEKKVPSQTLNANHSVNKSTYIEAQSGSDDLKAKEMTQRIYEIIQNRIKDESLKIKIKNLRDVVSDSETETRIWFGFGIGYPRCFILTSHNGKQEALYIAPKVISNKAGVEANVKVLMNHTVLSAPKSGWDEFSRYLVEQGIDSPIKLSSDEKHIGTPDGEIIVVEVKSGEMYSMVYFSVFTESKDGKKALKVCQRIGQEFDIEMGC